MYGQLEFTEEELQQTHKGLEGVPMPKFGGLGQALAKEMNDPIPDDELEPEPEESEAERIERLKRDLALAAPEYIVESVVGCQAAARGALVRPKFQLAIKRARQAEMLRLERERQEREDELARLEAERIAREEEMARVEAERKAREEAERIAREDRQREEARLEAERIARAKEAARLEEERIARERELARLEAERIALEKEEARLEAERIARIREEARLEAERVAREKEEARLEAERIAREEEQARQEARIVRAWAPPIQSQIRGILARRVHSHKIVQLKQASPSTTSFQAVARGSLARRRFDHHESQLRHEEPVFTQLQAAARGTLARRAVQIKLNELDELADPVGPVVELQAKARGFLSRQRIAEHRDALREVQHEWVGLQACARGAIARSSVRDLFAHFDEPDSKPSEAVIDCQAIARGALARARFQRKGADLRAATATFSSLQSTARGVLVRRNQAQQHEKLIYLEENRERRAETTNLQALCRGALVRNARNTTRTTLAAEPVTFGVVGMQAAIRAALARQRLLEIIQGLRASEDSTVQLQALIRAAQCRSRVRAMASALQRVAVQESAVSLQSFARAALTRRRKVEQRKQLQTVAPDVRGVQAQIRGLLARGEYEWWRDHIHASEPVAVFLQSVIRGARVRLEWRARERFWREGEKDIVTVQSLWRSKQQGALYRALARGTCVPVEVVRAFAHLLSDSDADWADEIEVGRLRRLVVRSLRDLSTHEHDLSELDRKIALLVKNVIGIEELVRLKNERGLFGTGSSGVTTLNSMNSRLVAAGDPFAEKQAGYALDRAGQAKLQLYQTLFFLLQTRPGYLARLYVGLDQLSLSERETKQVEKAIWTLFGYGQDDREEFLLLKLVEECVRQEAALSLSPSDLLGGRRRFTKFVAQQYSDRAHVASADAVRVRPELVGPPIVAILNDHNLDLETNPKSIFTSLRNGQWPQGDNHEILQDVQIRTTYIRRLKALRATADLLVNAITSRPRRLPYGLRYIARAVLRAAESRFPEQNSNDLARSVGYMVYYRYFRPAIIAPEEYGVLEPGVVLDDNQRHIFSRVDSIMSDIAHGKVYGTLASDWRDGHLEPLNEFMVDSTRRFTDWILAVVDVPDLEIHFASVDALDATGQLSRAIDISPAEVYAFHALLLREIEVVAPNQEDVLRDLLHQLGPAPIVPSPNEVALNAARNQEVTLELVPHGLPDPEAEGRALWVETKRLVLNVLRVQTGPDLFTVMLEEVTEADERAWLAVAEAEREAEQKNAFVSRMGDRPLPAQLRAQHHPSELPLEDLRRMSFVDVKAHTLQRVLDLERTGKVTRANGFQDLLDALAHDIRLKNTMRSHRKAQMKAMSDSLRDLAQRKAHIDDRIRSYHSVIEQSIAETHKKGHKKRGLRLKDKLSWSPQAKHMRDLDRKGKLPAFGSYLFSSAKLVQRGVLLSLDTDLPPMDFIISSDRPGLFRLAATPASGPASPGALPLPPVEEEITLEGLLELQDNGEPSLSVLGGIARFEIHQLIDLINRKFYASS